MQLTGDNLACARGGRAVFANISFRVSAGEALELGGPNGSGKSSLLRLIAGLAECSAGTLHLAGGKADTPIAEQAHFIAHREAVKGALTTRENLEFWRAYLDGGSVADALEAFALTALADYPAALLSQGQRRRLALSRLALVPRPLWLLDEPSVGLDAASVSALQGLVATHLKGGGLVVAATHVPLGIAVNHGLRMGAAP